MTRNNIIQVDPSGSAVARFQGFWVRIPLGHGRLSVVSIVWRQEEVTSSGWSLVQRSPTECGPSECNCESSVMRRCWPTRSYCAKDRGGGH